RGIRAGEPGAPRAAFDRHSERIERVFSGSADGDKAAGDGCWRGIWDCDKPAGRNAGAGTDYSGADASTRILPESLDGQATGKGDSEADSSKGNGATTLDSYS